MSEDSAHDGMDRLLALAIAVIAAAVLLWPLEGERGLDCGSALFVNDYGNEAASAMRANPGAVCKQAATTRRLIGGIGGVLALGIWFFGEAATEQSDKAN